MEENKTQSDAFNKVNFLQQQSPIYKVLDLFGNEETVIISKKKEKPNLFSDYDGFLEKFEIKKTTDDCYTPKEVMDIVIDYVNQTYPLTGKKIIRPFFPGGDFESIEYTDDMVVIDNPPFSIITKICKYYISKGVKFFLFCPHLTAFSSDIDATHIIASADITYENGATIKTAFVTNIFGDLKIIGDAELHAKFKELNQRNKINLPKYQYPDHIITVSKVAYCIEKGVSLSFNKKEVKHYKGLDSQKKHGKALFGSGFIISDKASEKLSKSEQMAEEASKIIAIETAKEKKKNSIFWELSNREKQIIKSFDEL